MSFKHKLNKLNKEAEKQARMQGTKQIIDYYVYSVLSKPILWRIRYAVAVLRGVRNVETKTK